MKIVDLVCAEGRSGYFNKDLAAIRAGNARQDGFAVEGTPVTPGFDKILQPGRALSVMLVLDDGLVGHGDCVDVIFTGAAGRDPLFRPDAHRPMVEGPIRERLIGRDCGSFRQLAEETDRLQSDGKPLHTAVRFGLSQALLHAASLAQRKTMAEVVADEYGTDIATAPVAILSMCPTDHRHLVDKMIMKRAEMLPHASFANVRELGADGSVVLDYAEWVAKRISTLGGPDYKPVVHLDLYGTIGEFAGGNMDKAADFLLRIEERVRPYDLYIETPVIAETREAQIEAFRALRRAIRKQGSTIKLIADEWCNNLDDIKAFADAEAADFLQVKAPDLGGFNNSIEALLYCGKKGIGRYLGGTGNETDHSSRITTHVALACRADFILCKPGQGVDEGLLIQSNEMARTLALIEARRGRPNG